jgi:hypothetical protein
MKLFVLKETHWETEKEQSLGPEICEKYFLSFSQKVYKLRQLILSQFVYFLSDKVHNYVKTETN